MRLAKYCKWNTALSHFINAMFQLQDCPKRDFDAITPLLCSFFFLFQFLKGSTNLLRAAINKFDITRIH